MREPRRDHYLAPVVGDDTGTVIEAAIAALAELRGLTPLGDPCTALHLLASIVCETQRRLPEAVARARDQQCSWAEIGDLVGVTRGSAQQRYGGRAARARSPLSE
jgi:hypothetical protein